LRAGSGPQDIWTRPTWNVRFAKTAPSEKPRNQDITRDFQPWAGSGSSRALITTAWMFGLWN